MGACFMPDTLLCIKHRTNAGEEHHNEKLVTRAVHGTLMICPSPGLAQNPDFNQKPCGRILSANALITTVRVISCTIRVEFDSSLEENRATFGRYI